MKLLGEIRNVSRTYGTIDQPIRALKDITLDIPFGAFIALKGRSGSGKTTLLNIIGGLDRPTTGEVIIAGKRIHELDDDELSTFRYQHLGLVFQSFALIPTYSSYENVELLLRLSGGVRKDIYTQVLSCLKMVGLGNRLNHRPDELSGGQRQRLAVARALVNRPLLILADEPTGELDTDMTRQMFALFRRLVEERKTTILVTSHSALVDQFSDYVYELRGGLIFPQV